MKNTRVSIISYRTRDSRIAHELFGFKNRSNYRYEYRREGILSGRWHIKLGRGVVAVLREDEEKVLKILEKYKAGFEVLRCVIEDL